MHLWAEQPPVRFVEEGPSTLLPWYQCVPVHLIETLDFLVRCHDMLDLLVAVGKAPVGGG